MAVPGLECPDDRIGVVVDPENPISQQRAGRSTGKSGFAARIVAVSEIERRETVRETWAHTGIEK